MTTDSDRFEQAQRDRLAQLREACADKPAHAEFLEILIDAAPGEVFEDLPLPRGVARRVADALITDIEWINQLIPPAGAQVSPFPCGYARLRAQQGITAARGARTRAANNTWAGFTFEKGK